MKMNLIIAACFLVLMIFTNSTTQAGVIFSDDFNRPDSDTVGAGWTVLEDGSTDIDIFNNSLHFDVTTGSLENRPMAYHTFSTVSSGTLYWTFDFSWSANPDYFDVLNDYKIYMQLGDSSSMTYDINDPELDEGIGVNLVWGDILGIDEYLAYINGGYTGLALMSGSNNIEVLVDLDADIFSLKIDSFTANGLPLAGGILSIDTVRFYTYGTNPTSLYFNPRSFDNVLISTIDPIPEPSTFLLLGSGLAGLAFVARRRKRE